MKLFFIIFISLSLNVYSEDLTNMFNTSLNNPNISFIQSSINPYTNSIDKSEGRIIRNKDKTIVFVDTPFKEKYELTKNEIIITDIELDQQSIISREDFSSNIMMNIFLNGFIPRFFHSTYSITKCFFSSINNRIRKYFFIFKTFS